jgi:hypothetical protein
MILSMPNANGRYDDYSLQIENLPMAKKRKESCLMNKTKTTNSTNDTNSGTNIIYIELSKAQFHLRHSKN